MPIFLRRCLPAALSLGICSLASVGICVVALAVDPPSTQPAHRLPPRKELSESEYKDLAAKLRANYLLPSAQWPKATVDEGVAFHELGRLPEVSFPKENPYSKEKEDLGRQLFFDPRLSGSGEIACASCHDPDLAWADGRTVSFGHGRARLRRNSPSIQFAAYASSMFWDGRSGSLEDQAKVPVVAHEEMDGGNEGGIKRIAGIDGYRQQFKTVFGSEDVTLSNAAKAIATFERGVSQKAGRSPFDKFLAGESKVMSDSAIRGLNLFRTDARCINCHSGPVFSDNLFHDDGFSYYGRKLEDLGRFNVTNEAGDVGRFRTPSLRNVGRTRPYLHNGLLELEGLIAAYDNGMGELKRSPDQKDDPLFPTKDALLKPLGLNKQDRTDLLEFLLSLNEPLQRIAPPTLPDGPQSPATKPAVK